MEQVIVEILSDIGIYEQVREKVSSDGELVELFQNDFEQLIKRCGG
ncbi:MAG: hypothetical protein U5R49_22060 [Deltaproteobacteria bacterium]|nr:hypothetical protein [Deltaproteobacteria bacterium]